MVTIINNLGLVYLKRLREVSLSLYEIMDSYLDSRMQRQCHFKITETVNQP